MTPYLKNLNRPGQTPCWVIVREQGEVIPHELREEQLKRTFDDQGMRRPPDYVLNDTRTASELCAASDECFDNFWNEG